uniref:Uncharacterized protein n=1 Tax=Sus scrofa TaxID=9823 RepID=A0A8D0NL32_PIG
MTRKDSCTPMFIAALYTTSKTQKQPKCQSTEEWMKKRWYIYTMEYYSAIKRKERKAFTASKDLEIIMLSEVSQTMRHPTSNAIIYMWNIRKGHNELLCRTDTDSQTLKNLWFPSEIGWGVGGRTEGLGWKCYKIWL